MDPDFEYHCDHKRIEEDTCLDCGLITEDSIMGYEIDTPADDTWARSRIAKKETFNYYNKLATLDLEPTIVINVCEQVSRLQDRSHVRFTKHLKNLFVMIYIACVSEGKEFSPTEIGRKLKMSPKEIRESVKMASTGIDDDADKNPVCVVSPFNFIKELSGYFRDIHVIPEDNLIKLEELIDLVMDHNPMICNENPRGMATVFLKMYYDHNKINVSCFFRKTKRTMGYVKVRENMIITTLNSIESKSL